MNEIIVIILLGGLGIAGICYGVRSMIQDARGLGERDDAESKVEARKNEKIRKDTLKKSEKWRNGQ